MYDSAPYIDPTPRVPGYHDAACVVVWRPAGKAAAPRRIVGDFLDGDSPDGAVTLGCGIEEALSRLEIDLDYDHLLTVCDLVNRQLAQRPWAEVKCPQGSARISLVPR